MKRSTRTMLAVTGLTVGLLAMSQVRLSAGDDDVKLVISAAGASSLIADDIKLVNEALKMGKDGKSPTAKDLKRAKMLALDIALTAKASKNEALYGQAVKVIEDLKAIEAVDKDKKDELAKAWKEARSSAADLSKPKAEGKSDAIKAVLWDADNKSWDKDLAMQLFKLSRSGGLGYEKTIKDFSEKTPPASEMVKLSAMANKIAMIAQAIEQMGTAEKSPADWKKFSETLRTTAVELSDAAGKKNAAAVKSALGKMDTSCVNCHTKFKTP